MHHRVRAIVTLALILAAWIPGIAEGPRTGLESRQIDVVIVLDTSGSMQGLLDAVSARVWDVVNELARLEPTPELRVGLLTFGSYDATEEDGWVLEQSALTPELDEVFARLTEVSIGGTDELVGRALNTAIESMNWSQDVDALRLVFLAGNESADQGVEEYDYRKVAEYARRNGILINALYAGDRESAVTDGWDAVARHGGGNFSAIDVANARIQIATPQDAELLELNQALNLTYVPYGEAGADGLANQVAQDSGASRLGVQSCSSRIVTKGGALYDNASWDLVDATLREDFNWARLAESELPEAMRGLSREAKIAYVEKHRTQREALQERIQELAELREDFLLSAASRSGGEGSVEAAMLRAIREQAMAKGFRCEGC